MHARGGRSFRWAAAPTTANAPDAPDAPDVPDALDAGRGMVAMTVLENTELVDLTHPLGRSKRHLRLALPDGVTYRTGDYLVVLPENPPDLVDRALRTFAGDPSTLRRLLTSLVDLSAVATAAQVRALAAANPCPAQRDELRGLVEGPGSADRFAAEVVEPGTTLLDLMQRYPAGRPPVADLVPLLPPARPRHYSIASSALSQRDAVDLIVSVASRSTGGRRRPWSTAARLAGLAVGTQVRAAVRPCRDALRATARPGSVPLVLVGAGSGLAPLRAFVADRVHLLRTGERLAPALLYFGCDHPDVDFLHREELAAAERAGAVRLRPAFSAAPVGGSRFVQDRIVADAHELWPLLTERGGRVHVCGDAAVLGPAVRAAFEEIHRRATGAGGTVARRWLADLVATGAYVEDVFAA